MRWVSVTGFCQAMQVGQQTFDARFALHVGAVRSPRRYNNAGRGRSFQKIAIIFVADGFGERFHNAWIRGSVRKRVGHIQPSVPPFLGKQDTAPYCWIVLHFVRRTGIEPDKHGVSRAVLPFAP